MNPVLTKIPENLETELFAIRITELPFFSTQFHFHKECQIVYIIESEGTRIIGDNINAFKSNELIFLGPNLPHVWHNDKQYRNASEEEKHARSIALFFDLDKATEALSYFGFGNLMENLTIKAKRGINFFGESQRKLKNLLLEMSNQTDLKKLATFIKIIDVSASSKEFELLASSGYINTY